MPVGEAYMTDEHFFESIKIKHFRGIKSLEIDKLARVNLFVGKNNCGKTSLLESVFLLTGIGNPGLAAVIENLRGITLKASFDWEDYFHARDHKQGMEFSTTQRKGKRRLKVSPLLGNPSEFSVMRRPRELNREQSSRSIGTGEDLIGFNYDFSVANRVGKSQNYQAKIYQRQVGDNISLEPVLAENYREVLKGRYLLPIGWDSSLVDNMLNAKRKDSLLRALRFIEPDIQDIKTGADGVSVDIGLNRFIPINLLGGGTIRILDMLSSIEGLRKKGIITIDEIENGLHVSTMKEMWKMILEHSAVCGTQIFATTHDRDVVQSLTEVLNAKDCPNDWQKETVCFHLRKHDSGEVMAFRYPYDSLQKLKNSNIDIRK